MPFTPVYRPEARFAALGPDFADVVRPADFPKTIVRFRNDRIAARVGLDALTDDEWVRRLARFEPLPGAQGEPLAMRYHGHQFRVYNPDLGDGRGFLYAQLREAGTDRLLDLGTKGSGRTPWSRTADGRLTLKGGVREVLATETLEALGVPTSKSLSLVETGEDLVRHDEPSPTRSAVLVRLSHGHVRFGTFQRHAYEDRPDRIRTLVDHVVEVYYPELLAETGPERARALLRAVVARSARLVARWTAAGFVHGVLNTDNMNMTGESFDYGPYRFLPAYDPMFTAAYFDHAGLYAFGRQAPAVFWNLAQLAGCLTLVAPEEEPLVEALNGFADLHQAEIRAAVLGRLGLRSRSAEEDAALADAALALLSEGGEALRWEPLWFDWFCGAASTPRALSGPRGALYETDAGRAFRERLAAYDPDRPERLDADYFRRGEPEELLYPEIEAIWARIARSDDWSAFHAKIARLGEAREAYAIAVP
jgi:uncharacterized protein YdiU (UPF0061 family)